MNVTAQTLWRYGLIIPLFLSAPLFPIKAQNDLSDKELDELMADDTALEAWLENESSEWGFSALARTGIGYSDNVLLATVNPQSGDYLWADLELLLNRYPDDNGEFYAYIAGTDIRYSGVEGADKEQLWLFDTEWKRNLTDQISGTLKSQYVFFDQIIDLSLNEREVARQRIQYHGYGAGTDVDYRAGKSNVFTVGLMAFQEDYAEVLGQNGRRIIDLKWERSNWKGLDITAEIGTDRRDHDDRVQRDQFGRPIDELLITTRGSGLVDISKDWGKTGNIQSSFEFKYLENRDNGSGYYDYDQWALNISLDGEWEGIESNLTLGVEESNFLVQKAERFGVTPFSKTDYWAELIISKQLMKRISAYIMLEHEESQSNIEDGEYSAFSASFGFQINFLGEP